MKKRTYKNKKQQKKSSFGFFHIFLIAILTAGLVFLGLSILMPAKKKDTGGSSEPLNTAVNETEKKREEEKKKEKDEGENQDKTPVQYDGEKPDSKDSFNASITRNEVSGGKYSLRISIYELVSGTCTLHMETKSGDTVDRTADIVSAGPDSSACEGFDIPTNGISSGAYSFTVTISNDTKKSTINGVINI